MPRTPSAASDDESYDSECSEEHNFWEYHTCYEDDFGNFWEDFKRQRQEFWAEVSMARQKARKEAGHKQRKYEEQRKSGVEEHQARLTLARTDSGAVDYNDQVSMQQQTLAIDKKAEKHCISGMIRRSIRQGPRRISCFQTRTSNIYSL